MTRPSTFYDRGRTIIQRGALDRQQTFGFRPIAVLPVTMDRLRKFGNVRDGLIQSWI